MNRKGLYILLLLISLLFIVGCFALKSIGEAFGTKCEHIRNWHIGEYKITKYRCLGWAGPWYNNHYLYKEGKQISQTAHVADTCTIVFVIERCLCLKFSICDSTVSELTPQKKKLASDFIDSVHMMNTAQNLLKALSRKEITVFVNKWNTAPVTDFRPYQDPFYPATTYIIKVFSQGQVKIFETCGFMIKDNESWVYSFLEPGEDRAADKFGQMWDEIGKE